MKTIAQVDAEELAKFFRWFQEHTNLDPLSAAAQRAVEESKNGKTVIISTQSE